MNKEVLMAERARIDAQLRQLEAKEASLGMLNTRGACKFLTVSRSTIWRMRRAGLPYHRISAGRVVFDPVELRRFVDGHQE